MTLSGWQGWAHFLGTGPTVPFLPFYAGRPHGRSASAGGDQNFLTFENALARARAHRFNTREAWAMWCRSDARPADIPVHPDRIYKYDGWRSWGHWLGWGNTPAGRYRQYLSFDDAVVFARKQRFKTQADWEMWCRFGVRPVTHTLTWTVRPMFCMVLNIFT